MALPPAPAPAPSYGHLTSTEAIAGFIFVKIPVGRRHDEADPLHRREDTIDQMLRAQGLGLVVGWGDSLGERRPDGQRPAAYIRIDINATDVQATRSALRALLPTLGAPAGTEIHYTLAGHSLQDIARETGWQLEQAIQPLQNRPHP
ncbi:MULTISPECIES: hypothetical protein [unclassified Acidovorax]|jgi:hypothetical protein|uniref:hypothetical protein n=1 Tax=unclassified Acidovorax TaxID=2684926 RepID=UPI000B3FF06A|nr:MULTISPECIES: hypothetical protein [unclassified Acidovorax]